MRQELLANVSHELHPLTSIRGFIQAILEGLSLQRIRINISRLCERKWTG